MEGQGIAEADAVRGLPRDTLSRVGIVLLNVLAPGLGLLRTGRWRLALTCLVAPFAIIAAAALVALSTPRATPIGYAIGAGLVLLALLAVYAVAAITSWRTSGVAPAEPPIWSRWYVLLAALAVTMLAQPLFAVMGDRTYKTFSIPSEAMLPTLEVGDHLIADMRGGDPVKVGDVVVFTTPSGVDYIKRVAAMPGDRIAMRGGVPVVNGRPARQSVIGERMLADFGGQLRARLVEEQLPGDARSHHVLDSGYTAVDDMPEQVVPAGHIFVLGDHRDRSADSRVSIEEGGSEMVPLGRVRGKAIFIRNGPRESSFGIRLDR